jgi:HK97 family phage portal protein
MGRIRSFLSMMFSRSAWGFWHVGRGAMNWRREVGEPMESSAVAAPILWFARNFPEAPPAMWQQLDNGQEEQHYAHPILKLLQRPNDFYTGPILWMATTTDWNVNGDAYWIVIPDRAGSPAELWWVPSWMIRPYGTDSAYVDHYEYTVNGVMTPLDPSQVIHFRYGLDPDNPRCGMSPLKSVLREVFTDNEAAAFTATLLRNMGVPGLLISPDGGGATLDPEEAKETKADFETAFSGDRRGKPIVMMGATKVEQFGFNPDQMLLRDLRQVPEERITAVLGIPAIVAGLGAGLARSTFTNMSEAREAAYEAGIIPCQRLLSEDIRFQLLSLYPGSDGDPFQWRFGFDLKKVRVLQDDLLRQANRHSLLFRNGLELRSEARRELGMEVDDSRDRVFQQPLNAAIVNADTGEVTVPAALKTGQPQDAPGAPAGDGNGDGMTDSGNGLSSRLAGEIADELEQRADLKELTAGLS